MTSQTDARLIVVISALKQSIELGAGPGLSVNQHPNRFFVNVIGEIDMLRAAERILERLDGHDAAVKAEEAKTVTKV
jgi:hypothetical protein